MKPLFLGAAVALCLLGLRDRMWEGPALAVVCFAVAWFLP